MENTSEQFAPKIEDSSSPKHKFSFKILFETIQQTALRFTFPLLFVFGLVILFFISINQENPDIDEKLWTFFGLGLAMSIAISLFAENFKNRFLRVVINFLAIAVLGTYVLLLPEKLLNVHTYQIAVLGLSFTVAAFVVSFYRKNNDNVFWEFSKTTVVQLIISHVFAIVLMLGLSLAVLSLQELFKIHISDKVYANLAVICFAVFLPIYFLSNIPTEKEKQVYKYDKFFKILGLYILLPILVIYTVILYVYLFQIIIVWELPNGWVTWLVSVLALGGFLTLLIQYPLQVENNKTARLFARFFPLILFPLLILMTVGISRRFGDYGLTINRSFVFLLNFWLYGISIYLFVSQSKHLKWILISFSCVAFLSVVGPWSVFNITKHSIKKELVNTLFSNNYLVNNKVVSEEVANKTIVTKEVNAILSAKIEYLYDNYGFEVLKPLFEDDFKTQNKYDVFKRIGIEYNYNGGTMAEVKYFNANLTNMNFSLDIASYNHLVKIEILNDELNYKDSLYKIEYKNEQLNITTTKDPASTIFINLKGKIEELSQHDSTNYTVPQMSVEGNNYKVLIVRVDAHFETFKGPVKLNYLEGFIFLK